MSKMNEERFKEMVGKPPVERSREKPTGQSATCRLGTIVGTASVLVSPSQCPRFERCNAPICPLDSQMLERVHLRGESTCLYLRLFAKQGLQGLFSTSVPRQVAKRVAEVYPILIGRYVTLKKQLDRAAKSPVKGFSRSSTEEKSHG
jgi:hypothetical protein